MSMQMQMLKQIDLLDVDLDADAEADWLVDVDDDTVDLRCRDRLTCRSLKPTDSLMLKLTSDAEILLMLADSDADTGIDLLMLKLDSDAEAD